MNKKYGILILIIIAMGIFSFLKNSSSKIYDPVDAGKVTYANLPENLKGKLTNKDVDLILELEFQYQQKMGYVDNGTTLEDGEPYVMTDELNKFIIAEAQKSNKVYNSADIDEVLKAEEVYLKQIGAME